MNPLRDLWRESRAVIALSLLAGSIGGLSGVALIALIHAELGRDRPSAGVVGLAFAGLLVLAAGARVVAKSATVRLGQNAVARLGVRMGKMVLALPLEAFERTDSSGLMTVLTEDVGVVAAAMVGAPMLAINVPIVVACLAYVGWLSPPVLVVGGLFAVVTIAGDRIFMAAGMRHLRASREAQEEVVGHVRGLIDGFRELKQNRDRREAFVRDGLRPAAERVRDRATAGHVRFAAAEGWSQFGFFGFLGTLLFVMPLVADVGRPALAGAVLVVLYIMTPLDVLLTWVPALGRARASSQKIEAVVGLLEASGQGEGGAGARGLRFRDAIRLEGVSYAYRPESDGSGFALGPVDLTLGAGEVVFLAGGNGSGKTTLVKLVAGLYDPSGGTISLDGRPVGPEDREAYRQLFSVVFADGHLFGQLYGIDAADLREKAQDGLERLELSRRVRLVGSKFSTLDLSQGQRRRLALLTAMLEDRPACVLDEWAANQDPHFKKFFYLELIPELRALGKAVLVISHDEEYYDAADRVVRLRDGLVVDEALAGRA